MGFGSGMRGLGSRAKGLAASPLRLFVNIARAVRMRICEPGKEVQMYRIKAHGVVVACTPSAVRKGVYYITVDLEGWGQVKYASTKRREAGQEVVLTDQRLRSAKDIIRWEESI